VRELFEETGLEGEVTPVDEMAYPTFVLEVDDDTQIQLPEEHDGLEWLTAHELIELCQPTVVSEGIAAALKRLGHLD
jgi:8-oxo-dGTP pyrophosphatase MutT (NUDIX family)